MIDNDFDEYLQRKLEDPEFKRQFEKASKRLIYIFNNVKSARKQVLIDELTEANESIDIKYLNKLPIKKLFNLAKYYKKKGEIRCYQ
jgi:hypothetical protein